MEVKSFIHFVLLPFRGHPPHRLLKLTLIDTATTTPVAVLKPYLPLRSLSTGSQRMHKNYPE